VRKISLQNTKHRSYATYEIERQALEAGFTLIELLLAMAVVGILLVIAFPIVTSSRQVYVFDNSRTSALQNLRSTMDLIGAEVRQAGQNVSSVSSVPAITLSTTAGNSTLEVFRAVSPNTLTICEPLNNGATSITIGLKVPPTLPVGAFNGCQFPVGQADDTILKDWKDYITRNNGVGTLYIFNRATATGDFVKVSGIQNVSGSTKATLTISGTLSQNYVITQQPIIYLVESRVFSLNTTTNILELVRDRTSVIEKVAPNITNMSIRACTAINASRSCTNWVENFTASSTISWKTVRSIEITLKTSANSGGNSSLARELTSNFLPRNSF
jgi:prepilin-type N-terminal cleavage/methylation domain-containing protein